METKHHKIKFAGLPTDYAGLCGMVVPRPIHDRAGYENALEIIEAMAGFEESFNDDQKDYFAVIADFVAAYEDSRRSRRDRTHAPSTCSNTCSTKMEWGRRTCRVFSAQNARLDQRFSVVSGI